MVALYSFTEKHRGEDTEALKSLARRGEIILVSPQGIQGYSDAVARFEEERAAAKLALGESAKADPDLPENAEFKALRVKLMFELPSRQSELKEQESKLVQFDEPHEPGVIAFGTRFYAEILYAPDDVVEGNYILLGPIEALHCKDYYQGIGFQVLSYMTPLGNTVWGYNSRRPEMLAFNTPGGKAQIRISVYDDDQE